MSWLSKLSEPTRPGSRLLEGLVEAHRERNARLERSSLRRRERTTRQIHRIQDLEREVEELKSFVAGLTRVMIQKGTFEPREVAQLVELVEEGIGKRGTGEPVGDDEAGAKRS